MAFDNFPYTNFHEINLDWILSEIKKIDPSKIPVEIADQLRKMLNDGTLKNIIEQATSGVYRFNDEYENYKQGTLQIIAGYLARHLKSDCTEYFREDVNGKVAYKYNTNYGYGALFNRNSTTNNFKYNDKVTLDGVPYPVFYADCSTFLSLITKDIPYESSPYAYMFNGGQFDLDMDSTLMKSCRENPDKHVRWTFDFLNSIGTSDMSELVEGNGKPLTELGTFTPATSESTINSALISGLKTGDIIFRGLSELNWWRGIEHCGYYIKDLADLDPYCTPYGFHPAAFQYNETERNDAQYGYVIEYMGSSDNTGYANTLRISPLSAWLFYPNSTGTVAVYSARVETCWALSNKQRGEQTMTEQMFNYINWYTGRDHESRMVLDLIHGILKVRSISTAGIELASGADLNTLKNGIYRTHTGSVINSLVNSPIGSTPATNGMTLITIGGSWSDDISYAFQIILENTSNPATNPPKIHLRRISAGGVWGPWYGIALTAE